MQLAVDLSGCYLTKLMVMNQLQIYHKFLQVCMEILYFMKKNLKWTKNEHVVFMLII